MEQIWATNFAHQPSRSLTGGLKEIYPFGTEAYDLWLRVDGTWFPKALEYVLRHVGREDFTAMTRRLTTTSRSDDEVSEEAGVVHSVHYFLVDGHTDVCWKTSVVFERRRGSLSFYQGLPDSL